MSWTAALLLMMAFTLWTLFARVVKEQGVHTETMTRRRELLFIPAKPVGSGRQKRLKLAVGEKWWAAIRQAYERLGRRPGATAPQLDDRQTFERCLCWHNPLSPKNWLEELSR